MSLILGEGDYDAMDNIMVRFSVGTAESSVQREIFIVINTDMLIEPDETFRVTFEPINVNLGDTDNFDIGGIFETTVTIIDGKLISLS